MDEAEVKRIIAILYDELDGLNGQVLYERDVQRVLEWAGINHGRHARPEQEPK
jgi:hypothetical protein